MPSIVQFAPLIFNQLIGRQQLERVPEPTQLTETESKVTQYDAVMGTKLVLAYAAGLTMIHQTRDVGPYSRAIDLACGPGHYSICLSKYLGYEQVVGIDLSKRMVDIANKNASTYCDGTRVNFSLGDATNLETIANESVDLASFTDAAHHFPDIATVRKVLYEMDRVTKKSGIVMAMDLVRLRTRHLTERYVKLLGHDYVARGLPDFYDDFWNSMFAAWTAEEFRQAIPNGTERRWFHVVPRGLPSTQMILGISPGSRIVKRSGVPWKDDNCPIPNNMLSEWKLLRTTLSMASWTEVPR